MARKGEEVEQHMKHTFLKSNASDHLATSILPLDNFILATDYQEPKPDKTVAGMTKHTRTHNEAMLTY